MTRAFNLADLFEACADAAPERAALVAGDTRYRYAELDRRGNRVAHHLLATGIGAGDHVAVWSRNRAEWVETMLGCFKARAVPINVNYRYTAAEVRFLLLDCAAASLVVERGFLPLLARVRAELPGLRHVLVLDDGASEPVCDPRYDEVLAAADPGRDFAPRSADDHYVLYTGGTTGMPKGVVWRHEDIFFGALSGADERAVGGTGMTTPDAVARRAELEPDVRFGIAPLMHGNGQWAALNPLTGAGTAVVWTGRRFDAERVLALMAAERVRTAVLVGDAMARPLVEVLEMDPGRFDLSHLRLLGSGGAILSPTVKRSLLRLLPACELVDAFGASETGSNGRMTGSAGGGPPRFAMNAGVSVLDEELRPVPPGGTGLLAVSGHIPIGYHGDPVKTAATFRTDPHGVRWAVPGDVARRDPDGTIVLLGRGSVSVNTGGEKVFAEEVEAVLKAHPAVFDALVIGVPDERLGQRVAAVVQPRPGFRPTLDELSAHVRSELAGYKMPRELHLVTEIVRTPAGKPDYRWAAEQAAGRAGRSSVPVGARS
jgi:fatty-acyl-CoA synthase